MDSYHLILIEKKRKKKKEGNKSRKTPNKMSHVYLGTD